MFNIDAQKISRSYIRVTIRQAWVLPIPIPFASPKSNNRFAPPHEMARRAEVRSFAGLDELTSQPKHKSSKTEEKKKKKNFFFKAIRILFMEGI